MIEAGAEAPVAYAGLATHVQAILQPFDIGKQFPYYSNMPLVHAVTARLLIYVYADEHAPSHFRVKTPEREAQVWLANLTVKENSGVPSRSMKKALTWAAEHRVEIATRFNQLNPRIAK